MGNTLPPPPKLTEAEERSVLDYDVTVQAIVDYILSGKAEKIVMMVGAGISVSAGIPDFRSPGTGLYNNLQKYNLPSPQSMFEIEYFRRNPKPFCELAREMYPGNFRPTPTHWFIRLLQEKGLLMRCYTQNIDTLEREAGIHDELLVEAHGSFGTARCIECGASYTQEWVREQIFADRIPRCTQVGCVVPNEKEEEEASSPHPHPRSPHAGGTSSPRPVSPKSPQPPVSGLVKPNIVFFGESLPKRFFSLKERDLPNADLIIVAGTSLAVHPFAGVKDEAGPLVPRLLINREPVGQRDSPNGHGFRFDCYDNYRDVAFLADCDRAVTVLCHLLGWKEEFEALVREYGKGITLPDLLGPIAEGEDAEEKLRQDIVHPWRRPPPPHPDLEVDLTGLSLQSSSPVISSRHQACSVHSISGDVFLYWLSVSKCDTFRSLCEKIRDKEGLGRVTVDQLKYLNFEGVWGELVEDLGEEKTLEEAGLLSAVIEG
eukprot:CAMPEP_0117774538 /NCGR_PEP_ID=MMETSP0947-20121206/26579_1 /TAXON_ID=44440 /ORGANISM="Chattonella subsalsa, Strain CCMP2191" /LENGTH=486 /DNA_ID=CAMNT_0005601027 /DNA_START=46 /DNA_END=1502 /DNA_ORIENTATION=+